MPKFPGRIVHVPAVPYGEVNRYLRCIDIFVLASQTTATWKEQFGLTLAQAMLTGIPAVASNSGAIPDVLGPGGLIFAEGNSEELVRTLKKLLESPDLRRNLGVAGRKHAMNNYTIGKVAAAYMASFERARAGLTLNKRSLREAVMAPRV
jgi:glycosyltransferase involved in cell wall biosynthesis